MTSIASIVHKLVSEDMFFNGKIIGNHGRCTIGSDMHTPVLEHPNLSLNDHLAKSVKWVGPPNLAHELKCPNYYSRLCGA